VPDAGSLFLLATACTEQGTLKKLVIQVVGLDKAPREILGEHHVHSAGRTAKRKMRPGICVARVTWLLPCAAPKGETSPKGTKMIKKRAASFRRGPKRVRSAVPR